MKRRHVLDLAMGTLAVGSWVSSSLLAGPSVARADCAVPVERAQWLVTNVHAGGHAFVWLGQPRSVPVPTELEATLGGAPVALPITWVVPGVARITVPPTASHELVVRTPPRATGYPGDELHLRITAGPSPARLSGPPTHARLERRTRPVHYDPAAEYVTARFDAVAGAHLLLARWGAVGSFATLEAGASSAEIFAVGACGNRPLDVPSPRRGETVELALVDDEGNASIFVRVPAP